MVDIFEKRPDIDIIYGDFNYVDSKNKLLSKQKTIPFNSKIFRYDFDFICQPASFGGWMSLEKLDCLMLT